MNSSMHRSVRSSGGWGWALAVAGYTLSIYPWNQSHTARRIDRTEVMTDVLRFEAEMG
jgi:hypothetical protein